MKQIQWYPGHMAKTKRIVKEKIKQIDIVFELLDARIPLSSQNPVINEIIGDKPRIILLNKADLADQKELSKWIQYFEKKGFLALKINAISGQGLNQIEQTARGIIQKVIDKELSRGRKERAVRAMILGIPNVGKSTLINKLASKKKLVTGDRPGVTKQAQYIKIGQHFELLDTPGILWPKFEDEDIAYKLALIGAIKDDILPIDDIAIYGFKFLYKFYRAEFESRYDIKVDEDNIVQVFDDIGINRGCLLPGKNIDYDRVCNMFLHDFRHDRFGKIIMDRVSDV
ncbi:ribosome biogenesis GTPase YlqF [Candidatus Izimaplasma bacterium ZiA1]|uniref:ribosome biogenesis GTPase YlqF n=1 Tax=Candidatus Izimoplasma sp. ZiA1 TaxID=2024899 RepID=UPI000BAA6DCE|nr:ribosome biogenesis GTPase YlqF [Candidatus Izimaplasma bacterium ZiA1]